MKKAQGLSIDVIILVIIALLVLVVISYVLIGQIGGFGQKVNDCTRKQGICIPNNLNCGDKNLNTVAEGKEAYALEMKDWTCAEGQKCCIKVS